MALKGSLKEQTKEEIKDPFNFAIKIVSIIILLAMGIGFGLMPYYIKKFRTSLKCVNISNAFSGGLFLGIALFHILPESTEALEKYKIPWAYFCTFLSYSLILFVEKVAFNGHALLHGHEHGHVHNDIDNSRFTLAKLNESERETKNEENDDKDNDDGESDDKKEPMVKVEMKTKEGEKEEEKEKESNEEHKEDDHEHAHEHKSSGITPYILLLALGFHGFFEGMALGIQSEINNTLSLFLAIVAHKWAASLTLGISFVKAGVQRNQLIIMVLIFAFIGPVGVAIGLILSETANDYLQGIFLAISVGTFIYIACSEVLVEEFENPDNKFIKFFMFMLGGIFIGGLSLLELILDVEE